jgi:Zn-dependent protease
MAAAPQPTRGWTLGRLLGARVVLQPSAFVVILFLALLWGTGSDGELTASGFTRGGALALLLFASVFLHELGHAFAARAFHRKVTEIVITLWGGHTRFDSKDITPGIAGFTSLAGPLMNGIIAFWAWVAMGLSSSPGLHQTLVWLVYANVALGIFNILPGIPMDGGRVLEAIVWKATGNRMTGVKVAAWSGRIIAIGFLGYVLAINFRSGQTPDMVDLLWTLFIFSLLWPAATMSLKAAKIMERIDDIPVVRVMRSAAGVPYDLSLVDALTIAERAEVQEIVVLAADGSPAGHFAVASAEQVPLELRATTSLSALTLPVPRGTEVASDLTGPELLARVREWWGKTDALVVTDEGEVVGVVHLAEVSERLG